MASKYDLTPVIGQYLDRHLVFPLYQFLLMQDLYDEADILEAKINLLENTNMVDSTVDLYTLKNPGAPLPAKFDAAREEVLAKLQDYEAAISPIIEILSSEEILKQFTSDKQANMRFLIDNCPQFQPQLLDTYYDFAKFQYNCGDYYAAAVHLAHFRIISTDFDKCFSALWGKFACEILNQNFGDAYEDMQRLAEIINQRAGEPETNPLQLLHQRTWLIHWSLFVFFNHEKGRDGIIDLFFQPQYMNTIQTTCPHILRYVATAVITNKRRRNVVKELVRVIQSESYTYSDPITEFLECLYVNFDFDGAQQKLRECEVVLQNDFFLVACLDDFVENARLFIFENYCKVHPRISIKMLGEKLNLSEEKAEFWIVNLIRNARLDAKIDSKEGVVIMGATNTSVYHQVIEKTSRLSNRSMDLANSLLNKRAPVGQ